MIVDDDRNMANTVRDVLQDRGYRADVALRGQEAVSLVREGDYYCVLSDIRMPGMSGVELFHALQQTHPDLPIILMTAYVPGQMLSASVNQGVVAVMTKPLDLKMLFMYLEALE